MYGVRRLVCQNRNPGSKELLFELQGTIPIKDSDDSASD